MWTHVSCFAFTSVADGGSLIVLRSGSVGLRLFGSSVGTDNWSQDTGSFQPTGIDVTSISASWDFTLSAFDSATGTSTFTIVPAPASAALLGLGGLAAARRRR